MQKFIFIPKACIASHSCSLFAHTGSNILHISWDVHTIFACVSSCKAFTSDFGNHIITWGFLNISWPTAIKSHAYRHIAFFACLFRQWEFLQSHRSLNEVEHAISAPGSRARFVYTFVPEQSTPYQRMIFLPYVFLHSSSLPARAKQQCRQSVVERKSLRKIWSLYRMKRRPSMMILDGMFSWRSCPAPPLQFEILPYHGLQYLQMGFRPSNSLGPWIKLKRGREDEIRWDKVVRYSEMRWDEIGWGQLIWNNMKWGQTRRGERRWEEMMWDEMR